jgi:putative endonuclease
MAQHNTLGHKGEDEALAYLLHKGYTVLQTNWHFGKDEVDIVAKHNGFLVMVEVKTRTSNTYGEPEAFVGRTKQRNLIRAANAYLEKFDLDMEVRFDIVAITTHPDFKLEHISEAFYP